MKEFKGKTAVITGAASGIGKGLAGHCVREGLKVVLADIEEKPLREVERELQDLGGTVLAVRTDVSKLADIENLAQKTLEKFGTVDLLFNNAGVQVEVQRSRRLWEFSPAEWEWVIGVNLWGVIYGIKTFLPVMLRQGTEGHIVNTSSQAGLTSGGPMGMYRFTKHGVVSLSESLYFQLHKEHARIGVSVLCPVLVNTNLNEAERNRPAELQSAPVNDPLTTEQQALKDMFIAANRKGMPADRYAEVVFEAIRENRLYVKESAMFNEAIRQRAEDIITGRNPSLEGTRK
jgi:NAD(P)-dependent dehydrogenase (short-subunit alcohol dehydrogenase family)